MINIQKGGIYVTNAPWSYFSEGKTSFGSAAKFEFDSSHVLVLDEFTNPGTWFQDRFGPKGWDESDWYEQRVVVLLYNGCVVSTLSIFLVNPM